MTHISLRVEHYGKQPEFILRPIRIRERGKHHSGNKPDGALWTSPIGSRRSWKRWCTVEEYTGIGEYRVEFELSIPIDRFLVINNQADMMNLFWRVPPGSMFRLSYPDWEKVAEKYDAVWLTEEGEYACRFFDHGEYKYDVALHGWDCETVLILNEEIITWVGTGQEDPCP